MKYARKVLFVTDYTVLSVTAVVNAVVYNCSLHFTPEALICPKYNNTT